MKNYTVRLDRLFAFLIVSLFFVAIVFYGQFISFGSHKPFTLLSIRLIFGISLFIAFMLYIFYSGKKQNLQHQEMNKTLDEEITSFDVKAFVQEDIVLNNRMQKAISYLKGRGFFTTHKIYHLPWYLLIGAPGAGKSSILENSFLTPLVDRAIHDGPIHGQGGTRYCDWWLTDHAILIDTAGRYTTQNRATDIEEKAWHGFLSRLKKTRPQAPLNGIILTVGIDEILPTLTNTERNITALALRKRLQDITRSLDSHIPIYLVLTKMDTLAGFIETFHWYDELQINNFWGIQNNKQQNSQEFMDSFSDQFNELINQISQARFQNITKCHSPIEAKLIHEFPHELNTLSPFIESLLKTVFATSQFEVDYLLSGIFFVSSTQEHYNPQWLKTDIAEKMNPLPVKSKSYFVNGLLKDKIFPESGLASLKHASAFRLNTLIMTGYTSVFILCAMCIYLIMSSYYKNSQFLTDFTDEFHQVIQKFPNAKEPELHWNQLVSDLNHIVDLPNGYNAADKSTLLLLPIGLDQSEKIGQQADQFYYQSLSHLLLPNVGNLLENALEMSKSESTQYEELRYYVMFFDQTHRDEKDLLAHINFLLMNANVMDEDREALLQHLSVAFSENVELPSMNIALVTRVRDHLLEMPEDLRLYLRIKSQYALAQNTYSLKNILGRQANQMFETHIDEPVATVNSFFTANGYYSQFKPVLDDIKNRVVGERWVLNDAITIVPAELGELQRNISNRYADDYISQWQDFIGNLQAKSFDSAEDGLKIFQMFSDQQKPLFKVTDAIRANISLAKPQKSKNESAALELALKKNSKLNQFNELSNDFEFKTDDGIAAVIIRHHFDSLIADLKTPAKMSGLQSALEGLLPYYQNLVYSDDASPQSTEPLMSLKIAVANLDPLLQHWFPQTLAATQNMVTKSTAHTLNQAWQSKVYSFYQDNIKNYYPVKVDSKDDINPDDFVTFFGPGGLLDQYYQDNLHSKIEIKKGRLVWHHQYSGPNSILRLYEHLKQIQLAFFSKGKLQVDFKMTPVSLDMNAQQINMSFFGQELMFDHAQPLTYHFLMNDETMNSPQKISIILTSKRLLEQTLKTPWGIYRLIQNEKVPGSTNTQHLEISLQGLKASFKVESNKHENPFNPDLFSNLIVPEHL